MGNYEIGAIRALSLELAWLAIHDDRFQSPVMDDRTRRYAEILVELQDFRDRGYFKP